jgi:hypothetical protein
MVSRTQKCGDVKLAEGLGSLSIGGAYSRGHFGNGNVVLRSLWNFFFFFFFGDS